MKVNFRKHVLPAAALLAAAIIAPVQAATVTFNLGTVFSDGSAAPDGPAPYATVTLDDGDGAGTVIMTVDVASTVGAADMDQLYLNFDSAFDLALLNFTYDPDSTGPDAENGKKGNGIFVGTDAFQSDGDGAYDILFDFPPPPGSGSVRFSAGETVIYTMTSTDAITASSFNFLSADGGGAGTYLAASHFISTGPDGLESAWVGAGVIPVPAAVWLFGSGLLGLAGVARRKRTG
jgi:hypothetical protein